MPALKWTPDKIKEVLAYRKTHKHKETLTHFHISGAQLHSWKTGKNYPKAKFNKTMEAIILLRKACGIIEEEISAGRKFRDSDAYVRLALRALEHKNP